MKDILSNAQWIWLPEGEALNQYGEFRCEFTVPADVKKVRLLISADSRYAASINGCHINASQFSDYPQNKVADEVDITPFVKAGQNVLAVLAYFYGEDTFSYRLGQAGLLFAIEADRQVLAVSDTQTICRQSKAYQNGEIERVTPQLSFSFRYDATAQDEWLQIAYVPDSEWRSAAQIERSSSIGPRPVRSLTLEEPVKAVIKAQGVFTDALGSEVAFGERMQKTYLSARNTDEMGMPERVTLPDDGPITLSATEGDGIYLLMDLGQEEVGVLQMDLELPCCAEVLIGYGEHLDDLRPRMAVGGRQFAAQYRGKAGRQTFTHYLHRVGCRYIMVQIYAPKATLHYMGMRPTRYPLDYRPTFRCADELHNRIAEVSRRTLELCMHEHYEDCPWREQALYGMDSRNQMLFGYYAFGEIAFAQTSLRLLADGLRPDGLLEMCAPSRIGVVIPSFSLAFVTAVAEQVTYSGDLDFAAELLPTVKRVLDAFLCRTDSNGLVPCFTEKEYWNFYEWSPGLDGDTIWRESSIEKTWDAPLHGWLLLALQGTIELCDKLGLVADSQKYRQYHADLRKAVEAFWDEERQLYVTYLNETNHWHYAQLTQSLMVCAGAVPTERLDLLLNKLANDNSLVPITLSHSVYKYDALMLRSELYARFIKEEIGRVWGGMLYNGATSFWETELGADDFAKAGSLCHGWSAVPLYFYYRYVLGEQLDGSMTAPVFCGLYDAGREE